MSTTLILSPPKMDGGTHTLLTWASDPPAFINIVDESQNLVLSSDASSGTLALSPTVSTTYNAYSSPQGEYYTLAATAHLTVNPVVTAGTAAERLTAYGTCSPLLPGGSGPGVPPGGGGSSSLGCLFLARDGHRRPLAAGAGAGTAATGYYSNDAGHSFPSGVIDADTTCADIGLLVDRHQNRFCAVYTKGTPGSQALYAAFGPVVDGFPPDAAPAEAAGISGLYPALCEHPAERGAALMLLVSGGSLVCAETGDYGENWTRAGTVASGVDFSTSGRAGLAVLENTAFAAYASGNGIAAAKSTDQGRNWTPCTAAGAAGPYRGVSLLGWQGTLYLLAFGPPGAAGEPPVPELFLSEDLAEVWTAAPLPKIDFPSAIGVVPETGTLRLGLGFVSRDNAATWVAV